MEQISTILGLLAQTSIHAGTGQQTGVVDLPIQREGHNGWPCVFGSAVKGALRVRLEEQKVLQLKAKKKLKDSDKTNRYFYEEAQQCKDVLTVFGPPPRGDEAKHAGALMVTDARLLLFPVRSLTSQFKWVTCPAALRRFQLDYRRLSGVTLGWDVPEVSDGENTSVALVPEDSAPGHLFLEEYRFDTDSQQNLSGLITSLSRLMEPADAEEQLKKQLVVVSDDSFMHIVSHATPVNAHISIDSATKTVRDGQLWYEETLPPETLLYIGLSATDSRRGEVKKQDDKAKDAETGEMKADKVLGVVTDLFKGKPWLQLGGNETVGMGWCAVKQAEEV